jgi:hypothetical protein
MHWFEFEDQPWFPGFLRRGLTDFLAFVGGLSEKPYLAFATKLQAAMAACGAVTLVGLCTGGAGPTPVLLRLLRRGGSSARAVLTDLYPDVERLKSIAQTHDGIDFEPEPIDATRVPDRLKGFRIINNGFHHFRPELATAVLRNAVESRQGIALLEATARTPAGLLSTLFSPLTVLITTPMIRPVRLSRFVFTYLIPLIPLFTLWDGVVSCLRVYSPEELRGLVATLPPNDFTWDIGTLPIPGAPGAVVTYLIGAPTRPS